MPKLTKNLPKECRDRNQSFSWYNGKRYYHGKFGTPEADENYKRFKIALLQNPALLLQDKKTDGMLVSELAASFLIAIESRTDYILLCQLEWGKTSRIFCINICAGRNEDFGNIDGIGT